MDWNLLILKNFMITIKNTKSETRITQTVNGTTRAHAVIHDIDLYGKGLIARIKNFKKIGC